MKQDVQIDKVLLAIFSTAGGNVDIAVADMAWLGKLPTTQRQPAIETHLGQLAACGFIRRSPGYVAVTAKGWACIDANTAEHGKKVA